jgi:chaperonin GroES
MARTITIAPATSRTTLRPLHDRVLVERLEEPANRPGRIVIPDSAREKPHEGRVIAVGSGRVSDDGRRVPMAVKAGDRILFGRYAGSEVTVDGQEYLIMKEEDVFGVLDA